MPGSPRLAFAAVVVPLLVLLAGCGGGGGGTTATSGQAATTGSAAAANAALEAKARRLIPIARQSQAVSSRKESLRIANAQAELLIIAQKDPHAIAPLVAALKKPDYEEILDLYNFYIQLGRPGSEKVLLAALEHEGFSERSSPMAFAFLASGNRKLVQGTRQWAARNGLRITGNPSGIAGPKWGQVGLAPPTVPTAPPPSP